MLRHNSPKRDEALIELQKIVSESIGRTNDISSNRLRMFNWTRKHLSKSDWDKTKDFWRKIL